MDKLECFEYAVVMTGYAGMEETLCSMEKQRSEIEKHLGRQWLLSGVEAARKELEGMKSSLLIEDGILSEKVRKEYGADYFVRVEEGGILTALWELGVLLDCGMTIELDRILMKQLTIEVGEITDTSPYYFLSADCCLYVTKQGEHLVNVLEAEHIPAAVIGHLTGTNDRVIRNGDKIQFLTPMKRSISTGMMK